MTRRRVRVAGHPRRREPLRVKIAREMAAGHAAGEELRVLHVVAALVPYLPSRYVRPVTVVPAPRTPDPGPARPLRRTPLPW
jgi:hypothetical protein